MVNANHKHFQHSARTKKDAACYLLSGSEKHPTPAVYLSHVTLECALKLRILRKNGAKHIDDLRRLLPDRIVDSLFNGATGHDLHHLAKTASIERFLAANGKAALLHQPEWKAMAGQRPYSLRYGSEAVSNEDAKRQVDFAANLTNLILKRTL
jgi:hypothetical protein